MTMRGPYQIRRHKVNYRGYKYYYVLVDTRTEEVINTDYTNTPIPPLSLRGLQQKLNTKAIAENPRGWLEI